MQENGGKKEQEIKTNEKECRKIKEEKKKIKTNEKDCRKIKEEKKNNKDK